MLRKRESRLASMGCGVLIAIGCGCSHRVDAPPATQYRNPPGQSSFATQGDIIVSLLNRRDSERFTALVAALQAADLTETLKGPGPFTLLAPTNEAFANLPPDEMQNLLSPENKQKLRKLLLFHVVPRILDVSQTTRESMIKTMSGDTLTLETGSGKLRVGSQKLMATLSPDMSPASNGAIIAIDQVLMP